MIENIDLDLKRQALEWADNMVREMCAVVTSNPTNGPIGKDTEVTLKEFEQWGLIDKLKDYQSNKDFLIAVKSLMAKEKYKSLVFEKANPPQRKLSKWEVVTGKMLKK